MNILVISGFLGSGKTTWIQNFLTKNPSLRVAIIENDFGSINLDALRLEQNGVHVRALEAGCVCCTMQDDLLETLVEIKKDLDPDLVIIEPSGISELSTIRAQLLKSPLCSGLYCVTLIDGSSFDIHYDNYPELMLDQMDAADLLVLNRAEDLQLENELPQFAQRIPDAYSYAQARAAFESMDWEALFAAHHHANASSADFTGPHSQFYALQEKVDLPQSEAEHAVPAPCKVPPAPQGLEAHDLNASCVPSERTTSHPHNSEQEEVHTHCHLHFHSEPYLHTHCHVHCHEEISSLKCCDHPKMQDADHSHPHTTEHFHDSHAHLNQEHHHHHDRAHHHSWFQSILIHPTQNRSLKEWEAVFSMHIAHWQKSGWWRAKGWIFTPTLPSAPSDAKSATSKDAANEPPQRYRLEWSGKQVEFIEEPCPPPIKEAHHEAPVQSALCRAEKEGLLIFIGAEAADPAVLYDDLKEERE